MLPRESRSRYGPVVSWLVLTRARVLIGLFCSEGLVNGLGGEKAEKQPKPQHGLFW